MPSPTKSKDEVLSILLDTFRREGYDGASLSSLSEATGLGHSSLYHHFPGGKEDMVAQVLDLVDGWMLREVVGPLGDRTVPPSVRVGRMLEVLADFYAGGTKGCIIGRLCASVDRDRFQVRLQGILRNWIDALAGTLVDGGIEEPLATERAEDAVARIQGSLVLADGLGEPAAFRRAIARLATGLLAPS